MNIIKILSFIVVSFLISCADSKTFTINNREVVVQPYGWMDKEDKVEDVTYQLCTGNIIWSVILSETIVAPILFTGLSLWEPVSYEIPKLSKMEDPEEFVDDSTIEVYEDSSYLYTDSESL